MRLIPLYFRMDIQTSRINTSKNTHLKNENSISLLISSLAQRKNSKTFCELYMRRIPELLYLSHFKRLSLQPICYVVQRFAARHNLLGLKESSKPRNGLVCSQKHQLGQYLGFLILTVECSAVGLHTALSVNAHLSQDQLGLQCQVT